MVSVTSKSDHQLAQFQARLAYLETELSCLQEPHREDGWLLSLVSIAAAARADIPRCSWACDISLEEKTAFNQHCGT
jgi:hypothetical protein